MLRGDGLQRLLTTEDVAAILGIAPATAIWWRSQRQGPQWMRLGRGKRAPIRYRPDAINAYIAQMECAEH
ncbi:helix-turn-helix transcriptional regulator [Microvirga makkahensis]|uniref:helix-turn-helix transcriptional regulator n=1 Tax=Microvirga makkahensis TaxID=1128670 RepID=UPI003CCD1D73